MSSNDLTAILDIINTNVSAVQQIYSIHQTPIPSLSEPYEPLAFEPELIDATNLAVAAATQLIAIIRPPAMSLIAAVGGVSYVSNGRYNANKWLQQHVATSIGAAEATNVPEILTEAGPKGLHVTEIAKKADTDANKLGLSHSHRSQPPRIEYCFPGRLLRLLSTMHIFQEVAPDVFANNRLSSVMASGKTLEEIKKECVEILHF